MKQPGAERVGDQHRRGDLADEMRRRREGLHHHQEDDLLHHLGAEGAEGDGDRIEHFLDPPMAGEPEMEETADQPLGDGGDGTGERRRPTDPIAVEAAGEPDEEADHGPTQHATEHRADGAGVGDGFVDLEPEIGAHDAEEREHHIGGDPMRQAHGHTA